MQTALECLPCFLKQALYTARLSTDSEAQRKEIIDAVARLLPDLEMSRTPPENSILVYATIANLSSCRDPFAALKKQSNQQAMDLLPQLVSMLNQAQDPLLTALKLSIAGNIIDYGAHHDFNLDKALRECLVKEPAVNHYRQFIADLGRSKNILYLADNCGELVFDGLVLEQLGGKVTLAVKETPIINDALVTDVMDCGLDKVATIVSNGTGCPGTPLGICSEEFQKIFAQADLIISKGQGNFETLSETQAPIYFLLTVKCPIVAEHATELLTTTDKGIKNGDMVFMRTPNWE